MFRPAALAVLIAGSTLIFACESGPEGSAPDEPARRFLSIGTAPPGGGFFPVGGALAEVLNDSQNEFNWLVTAEATKGSQENIRRLAAGELDLALANAAITYFAVRGGGAWEESHPVQAVMTLAPNVALFITPENSGVQRLGDLVGKRVVVGPAGAGFEYFVAPILEAHGFGYEDFTPLHNTQTGAVEMLADGSAAAAFLGGVVPTASITQASASQELRFLPFEEKAVDQLVAEFEFFDRATIPAGTYRGQDDNFHGLNVGSMHLITSADHGEELIYQVTRGIYEGRAEVVTRHAVGRAIQPHIVVRDTGTPFHPGAIRLYQEKGIWPEASEVVDTVEE